MRDTSISFMRSLCAGEIEEEVLFPFPTLTDDEREILVPVVDSVDDLLASGRWSDAKEFTDIDPRKRRALLSDDGGARLVALELHGCQATDDPPPVSQDIAAVADRHGNVFAGRRRQFDDSADGFKHTVDLIDAGSGGATRDSNGLARAMLSLMSSSAQSASR